jgi:hypothetical protein
MVSFGIGHGFSIGFRLGFFIGFGNVLHWNWVFMGLERFSSDWIWFSFDLDMAS